MRFVACIVLAVGVCISGCAGSSSKSPLTTVGGGATDTAATGPAGVFAGTAGWFALSGDPIVMFDPNHTQSVKRLAWAPKPFPITWSHDGSTLLVSSGHDLIVVKADKTQTIVSRAADATGSFTADDKHVIYSYGGSIYRVGADGRSRKVLAKRTSRVAYVFPGFTGNELSPDGKTIVYGRFAKGGDSTWVMNANGGNRREVVSDKAVTAKSGYRDATQISMLTWLTPASFLLIALDQSADRCVVFRVGPSPGAGAGKLTPPPGMGKGYLLLHRWGPKGLCPIRAALGGDRVALSGVRRGAFEITNLQGGWLRWVNVPAGLTPTFFSWAPPSR